jgi:hypothetical protein
MCQTLEIPDTWESEENAEMHHDAPPHISASYLLLITTVAAFATNMSDMLNLNCWVIGDNLHLAFAIEIAKSETVGNLKEQINNKTKSAASAHTLYLWKPEVSK